MLDCVRGKTFIHCDKAIPSYLALIPLIYARYKFPENWRNARWTRSSSNRRSLELTEDRLWKMGYGSDYVHLLFNLWYRDFNYTPGYVNNLPQVDHVFPKSVLKKVKAKNPKTGRMDL